jgi:hypothetical protein
MGSHAISISLDHSTTPFGSPFQGSELLCATFPGRCPGLAQDAPLGRNEEILNISNYFAKIQFMKKTPSLHHTPKGQTTSIYGTDRHTPQRGKPCQPGASPWDPAHTPHNEPCRGDPIPRDATKAKKNHPARFQIGQGGFRIKNATNIIRPRRNWPDIDR